LLADSQNPAHPGDDIWLQTEMITRATALGKSPKELLHKGFYARRITRAKRPIIVMPL
jgi:hypothetical protein